MSRERPSRKALLAAKLEASEAKRRAMELEQTISTLEAVVAQQTQIIRENSALLRRQRLPPRPYMNSTQKLLLACRQEFKCAAPLGKERCPRYQLGDGLFGEDLFEVDHIQMWSKSGRHIHNLRCLCTACHARITRRQIAGRDTESEGDEEEEE